MTWQDSAVLRGPSGLPYHVAWQGEGPLLMLLHGFTGHMDAWGDLPRLLARRCRLLGIDLPGHGQALPVPAGHRTFMDVIKDLEALLDRFRQSPVHCVGYSMGGRLGLALACQPATSLRSLCVISGSPGLAQARERTVRRVWDEDLAAFIQHAPPDAFHQYWRQLPLFRSSRRPRVASARPQRLGWSRSLSFLGTGVQPSFWAELAAVPIPVQFAVGQRDRKYVDIARQMQERVPDSAVVAIADAGHRAHLDNPATVAHHITRFVQDWQQ